MEFLLLVYMWSFLGEDLTGVTGSVRWTGNLLDWADVVARGGAGVAREQNGNNLEPQLLRLLAAEILTALDIGQHTYSRPQKSGSDTMLNILLNIL
jgi:hypothetical protein